jgi:UDP-2,4-diacetamido-2,4,6-trideoxy-beta-L-altropyranose hydrolase
MKAIFRVDSSTQIGSGHLMRCLTLAKRLQAKYDIYFVSRDLNGNFNDLICQSGFNLILLTKTTKEWNLTGYEKWLTVPQGVDVVETISAAKMVLPVELFIIDSYAIDEQWESRIREFTDKIFVIDDLANRIHDCDVLLDQNFYLGMEKRYNGLVPKQCQLLLGPQYVLLRDEFYDMQDKIRVRNGSVRNILVYFGGSDLSNETLKVLHALENNRSHDFDVNVIVGSSNPNKNIIKNHCLEHKSFHYYCQVGNMAQFMNEADLAIGAGGSTTWERCYMGLPTIVIAIAENQRKLAEDCAQQGCILYAGFYKDISDYDFEEIIFNKSMLKKMAQKCFSLFKSGNKRWLI